jgi:hypothetical protein
VCFTFVENDVVRIQSILRFCILLVVYLFGYILNVLNMFQLLSQMWGAPIASSMLCNVDYHIESNFALI